MSAFRLAHISDLHLPPPADSRLGLAPKRWLSRFAWRRKRFRHSPEVLAALTADLKAARPDHIAITGDLTNFSTDEEFAAARAWLEALGPPEAVTVSPGNHDALVGPPGHERFAPWARWLGDEATIEFPHVRRRGPVALVNLCSATPTAPLLAQGELDDDQLERLPAVLRSLGEAGLFRVVLLHHPPMRGAVSRRKGLRAADALLAFLQREGAELVLHGHAHESMVATTPGPAGPIPVLGAPSASDSGAHGEPARWHQIEVAGGKPDWRVRIVARGLAADGSVQELGRYRLAPVSADTASAP